MSPPAVPLPAMSAQLRATTKSSPTAAHPLGGKRSASSSLPSAQKAQDGLNLPFSFVVPNAMASSFVALQLMAATADQSHLMQEAKLATCNTVESKQLLVFRDRLDADIEARTKNPAFRRAPPPPGQASTHVARAMTLTQVNYEVAAFLKLMDALADNEEFLAGVNGKVWCAEVRVSISLRAPACGVLATPNCRLTLIGSTSKRSWALLSGWLQPQQNHPSSTRLP